MYEEERKRQNFSAEQQAFIQDLIDRRFAKIQQRNERRLADLSKGYEVEIQELDREIIELQRKLEEREQ